MKLQSGKKRSPTLRHLAMAARLFLFCLALWLVPWGMKASAEDNSQVVSGEKIEGTVVTFTNTKNTSPSLYVTKSIQTSLSDENDYSDAEFTFTLYLDGSAARQVEYTVWNENGKQVFLYEDGSESTEETSNAVAYLTSRYGLFTLKAGQTAKFSDLGAGTSYEVEEEETDGFTQIVPSGGANAVGTIASDGSVAAFTNLVTTGTDTEKSGIKVYKTVSFPDGWTIVESPAFTFTITVDGEELVFEDYEVYDTDTDIFKEIRSTDAGGGFTLRAGEYALFETDANVDFQITESETEGWRTTTGKTVTGSTGESVQTVVFNNATASFIVTKTLADGTEETDDCFTFFLTDAAGTAMVGASYWLYDIYGNPQVDTNSNVLSCITDTEGRFHLAADQAAVFYGIESGTQYSVSEVPVKGWNQLIPASLSGYTGKTVSDAVEILPFENEQVDLSGTLTVTKAVEAASGLAAPADDEFSFVLSDENGEPVSDTVYSIAIGSEVYTYQTDENGTFTLHAGETATFSSLAFGIYSVQEKVVPNRAHENYAFSSLTVTDGAQSMTYMADRASGNLDEDGLTFEYVNTYTAPSSITICKYKSDGTTYLSGVTFTLADVDGNVLTEKTTGADGKAYFGNLNAGTYTITETSTQDGYSTLVNSFTVTVPLTMTKDEVKKAGTDTTNAVWRSDTSLWYFFDITYNVTNSAVLDLPETGGNGGFLPVILGATLVASVAIAGAWNREIKRRKNGA